MPKYPGRIVSATPPSVSLSGASGVWTLEEVAQYEQAGTWPVGVVSSDPYFNQTVLLLHGDGTNGAQNNTFLDGSTNNFTITRNGNTTQGTFSPFSLAAGEWGNFFDGSGDYLSVADNAAFTLGASDFTIECWLYSTNTGVRQFFAGQVASTGLNTSTSFLLQKSSTNKLVGIVCSGSTAYTATSTNDLPLNAWTHVALVRDGNTLRQYINGVQDGTASVTGITINDSSEILAIGRAGNLAADHWFGYISNFRQVVGTCLYPSGTAFTPSSTPLSNASGTSLLTCQSNRFVDNSTNAFAITRNGDVRVTPFSPFAPTAAYSAGTNGGSGYFDGTSDYLSLPTSQQIVPATGDLTIEGWFYPTSLSADALIYTQTNGGASSGRFNFQVLSSGALYFQVGSASYTGTSSVVRAGQWNHLAVTRTGTSVAFYVNGATAGSGTVSGTIDTGSSITAINRGADGSASSVPAYYGSFRISDSVRSSLTTVPTAPFTSDGNTKLLLNFTNAGIFDNTGKNNLETVGNAQIDTTTKKFGTGSMEFDGSGDYLLIPDSPEWQLGSGDFTIEAWINTPDVTPSKAEWIVSQWLSDTQNSWGVRLETTGELRFWYSTAGNTASNIAATTPGIANNTWTHIAVVRNGSTVTIYVDGVSKGSGSVSGVTLHNSTASVVVGGQANTGLGQTFTGFIDDLRITKGVARYPTEPFPTAPFPDL